jgi:uncharacterized lipoprotein YajG
MRIYLIAIIFCLAGCATTQSISTNCKTKVYCTEKSCLYENNGLNCPRNRMLSIEPR